MLTRQQYIDCTYEEALQAGMDSFQLKYDGWWTRAESVDGNAGFFSQTERKFRECVFPSGFNGRLIGEFMQGTQWSQQPALRGKFFMFDIWELSSVNLRSLRYRDRYALLMSIRHQFPDWCQVLVNYPINQFEMVWETQVKTELFEGVVFRNQNQLIDSPLMRMKVNLEDTYTCTGFVEGEGKHSGRLGALLVDKKTDSGEVATVGGGFDDEAREYIWTHQSEYLGRQFDVAGKHRFLSGLLRHPNFVRWKE